MSDTLPTLSEVPAEKHTRVIGRYRLIQRVGEGAFAEVYFARDEETLAPVALKVLRDDIDVSIREQVRVRFLAEEKITRAIHHPYVVQIRETSPADARPCFLAMDFVAGRPFSQHVARLRQGYAGVTKPGRADYLAEVARLGHQVASAMSAAHGQGIVHRDLKPQNVLVCCEHSGQLAEVRIVDFGIAKAPVELFSVACASSVTRYWTELGTVMGSPPCMAPEQCGAAQVATGKADVFALGVMLFGSVLGVDIDVLEQRSAHLKLPEDLETALELRGPLPEAWERLLRAMLEHDPEARPDMAEVSLCLQRLSRTDQAFAHAVEAWVRRREVPAAGRLARFMQIGEQASYLTEDEQRFLEQAPRQRLHSLRRALVFSATTSSFLVLVITGGGLYLSSGVDWASPFAPDASSTGPVARRAESIPSHAGRSGEPDKSGMRIQELERALDRQLEAQARHQRSLEASRASAVELGGKLASCQRQSGELQRDVAILGKQLEKQQELLTRCDAESERLLLCRQENAVRSRELAETTQRLQMCTKSLRGTSVPPTGDLEIGMSVEERSSAGSRKYRAAAHAREQRLPWPPVLLVWTPCCWSRKNRCWWRARARPRPTPPRIMSGSYHVAPRSPVWPRDIRSLRSPGVRSWND
jgi:serine/threonine protein kinase